MSFVVSSLQEPQFCVAAPTPRAYKTLSVVNTESHPESKEHLCNFRNLNVPVISSRPWTLKIFPTLFMKLQDWEKPVFISCPIAVIKRLDESSPGGKDPFRSPSAVIVQQGRKMSVGEARGVRSHCIHPQDAGWWMSLTLISFFPFHALQDPSQRNRPAHF